MLQHAIYYSNERENPYIKLYFKSTRGFNHIIIIYNIFENGSPSAIDKKTLIFKWPFINTYINTLFRNTHTYLLQHFLKRKISHLNCRCTSLQVLEVMIY